MAKTNAPQNPNQDPQVPETPTPIKLDGSGEVLIVGCKLPSGLHLDLNGQRVTLNGTNSTEIVGGHGLTHNVPKEFFDDWMTINRDHPAVRNELIFANAKENDTKAEAKEKQDNKSGFEGLDQNKLPPGIKADDGK